MGGGSRGGGDQGVGDLGVVRLKEFVGGGLGVVGVKG